MNKFFLNICFLNSVTSFVFAVENEVVTLVQNHVQDDFEQTKK